MNNDFPTLLTRPELDERLAIDPAGRLLRRNLETGQHHAATGLRTYAEGNAQIHVATDIQPVEVTDRLRAAERLMAGLMACLTVLFFLYAYTILVSREPELTAPAATAAPARGLAAWEWSNGD